MFNNGTLLDPARVKRGSNTQTLKQELGRLKFINRIFYEATMITILQEIFVISKLE